MRVGMKQIRLTLDGACIGNPGSGQSAFVLLDKDRLWFPFSRCG